MLRWPNEFCSTVDLPSRADASEDAFLRALSEWAPGPPTGLWDATRAAAAVDTLAQPSRRPAASAGLRAFALDAARGPSGRRRDAAPVGASRGAARCGPTAPGAAAARWPSARAEDASLAPRRARPTAPARPTAGGLRGVPSARADPGRRRALRGRGRGPPRRRGGDGGRVVHVLARGGLHGPPRRGLLG